MLTHEFIDRERLYELGKLFDETKIEHLTKILLEHLDKEHQDKYEQLILFEKESHNPETQWAIGILLLEASHAHHKANYPDSPLCQYFIEVYESPSYYWFEKAVKQHYYPAYYDAALILEQGASDVCPNKDLCKMLLEESANKGIVKSQLRLAFWYQQKENLFNLSKLVDYDIEKACYWYEEAEKTGDPDAFLDLADNYYINIKHDNTKANELYLKLVDLGRLEHFDDVLQICYWQGDTENFNKYLQIIKKSNNIELLMHTYDKFINGQLSKLPDYEIEIDLLKIMGNLGEQKASNILKDNYKKTIFGKWKRQK